MPESQGQWITLAVVIGVTALILIADALVMAIDGRCTISMVLRRAFQAWPTIFAAVIFWLGVLIGHWFPGQ